MKYAACSTPDEHLRDVLEKRRKELAVAVERSAGRPWALAHEANLRAELSSVERDLAAVRGRISAPPSRRAPATAPAVQGGRRKRAVQRTHALAVRVSNRAGPLRALALDQDRLDAVKFYEFVPLPMSGQSKRGEQLYAMPSKP
jgi:hypothetical protein